MAEVECQYNFLDVPPGTANSTGPVPSSLPHPETCSPLLPAFLACAWLHHVFLRPREEPGCHLGFLPLLSYPHQKQSNYLFYLIILSCTCAVFSMTGSIIPGPLCLQLVRSHTVASGVSLRHFTPLLKTLQLPLS